LGFGWLDLTWRSQDRPRTHAERYLPVSLARNRTERVRGLELMFEANLALGNLDEAQEAVVRIGGDCG